MALEHDLLPCPFCGGAASASLPFKDHDNKRWSVGCYNKGCLLHPSTWATMVADDIESQCEAWNARVGWPPAETKKAQADE